MRVTIMKDGRCTRSNIVMCGDCEHFGNNHCNHPEYYPCRRNEKLYGDAYYTHAGVSACMLFDAKDPEKVRLIQSETEDVEEWGCDE